jgi:Raf kinase inhibitor-like YbhB/YbcL family protein
MRDMLPRLIGAALIMLGAGCEGDAADSDATVRAGEPVAERDGATGPGDAALTDAAVPGLDASALDAAPEAGSLPAADSGPAAADTGTMDAAPLPRDAAPLGDASETGVDASLEASTALSLTSAAFAAGQAIPAAHTCNGTNDSPPLSWNALAAAKSYAVVFTDLSNGLVHWVLWDVPAATTMLPAALPKTSTLGSLGGAKQLSYMSSVTGYAGPCPPAGAPHTYQFEVFALDEAPLSGVTATSTRAYVVAAIVTHTLGSAKLAGTFSR